MIRETLKMTTADRVLMDQSFRERHAVIKNEERVRMIPGSHWRDFDGDLFVFVKFVFDPKTGDLMVEYRDARSSDGPFFVLPVGRFLGRVKDSASGYRFILETPPLPVNLK